MEVIRLEHGRGNGCGEVTRRRRRRSLEVPSPQKKPRKESNQSMAGPRKKTTRRMTAEAEREGCQLLKSQSSQSNMEEGHHLEQDVEHEQRPEDEERHQRPHPRR